MSELLTIDGYAAAVGKSRRTVERWLERGQLEGVVILEGRQMIPLGTRPTTPTSYDVAVVPGPTSHDVAVVSPLGALGTLEDAAAVLGTTTGGVRRMAADGLLTIGRYGPRGALRVYVAPR